MRSLLPADRAGDAGVRAAARGGTDGPQEVAVVLVLPEEARLGEPAGRARLTPAPARTAA